MKLYFYPALGKSCIIVCDNDGMAFGFVNRTISGWYGAGEVHATLRAAIRFVIAAFHDDNE